MCKTLLTEVHDQNIKTFCEKVHYKYEQKFDSLFCREKKNPRLQLPNISEA